MKNCRSASAIKRDKRNNFWLGDIVNRQIRRNSVLPLFKCDL